MAARHQTAPSGRRHLGRSVLKTPHAAGPARGVCPGGGCRAGAGRRDPSGGIYDRSVPPSNRWSCPTISWSGWKGRGSLFWRSLGIMAPRNGCISAAGSSPAGESISPEPGGCIPACRMCRPKGLRLPGARHRTGGDVDRGDGEGAVCPVFEMACGKRDERGTEKTATEVFARPREQPDGSHNDTTKGWIAC